MKEHYLTRFKYILGKPLFHLHRWKPSTFDGITGPVTSNVHILPEGKAKVEYPFECRCGAFAVQTRMESSLEYEKQVRDLMDKTK